jgi:hypothetical protein
MDILEPQNGPHRILTNLEWENLQQLLLDLLRDQMDAHRYRAIPDPVRHRIDRKYLEPLGF